MSPYERSHTIPLEANAGWGRPQLQTARIRESLLKQQVKGFDWHFVETVGLPDQWSRFDHSFPEDVVTDWAKACGYESIEEAEHGVERPRMQLLCRPSANGPVIKQQLGKTGQLVLRKALLRQALILARCVKSLYVPDKSPILTVRRLQCKWNLYTIGSFYASEC
jgi:hypothetical protein